MAELTTSNLKRKLMMMIAEHPDVFELLDYDKAEYPDDLLGQRIFPIIKVDDTITEAMTIIGIKIDYPSIAKNELYKNFNFTVMIVSHTSHLITNTGACRTDKLAEKIIEIFNWNDQLDFIFELVSDVEDPLNNKFYFRRLVFKSITSNSMKNGLKDGRTR